MKKISKTELQSQTESDKTFQTLLCTQTHLLSIENTDITTDPLVGCCEPEALGWNGVPVPLVLKR